MKKFFKYLAIVLASISASGCSDYLDVVPDNSADISLLFNRKEAAYRALATCYDYIWSNAVVTGWACASDEVSTIKHHLDNNDAYGMNLIMGKLNADNVIMSYWTNNGGSTNLPNSFQALRVCNDFLDNIESVPDMTPTEISQWAAEVKALKAYYHFLLFKQYGPIPLVRTNLSIGAEEEEVMVHRESVDEVVNYIVGLLDEAIEALPAKNATINDYGRINKPIAAALKGQVLLMAASPLFNNNPMYYSFVDKEGQHLFPQADEQAEQEKWENAATALKQAIDVAEAAGHQLYYYTQPFPEYDDPADIIDEETKESIPDPTSNLENDGERLQAMYNFLYMMTDPQKNLETIWGTWKTGPSDWRYINGPMHFKLDANTGGKTWQWLAANMSFTEQYYTKNGIPMEEDPEFDYENRYSLVIITDADKAVAKPGEQTVAMHLNREPRFYASIGFDRSNVRGYGQICTIECRADEKNGKIGSNEDYNISGYYVRKLMNPASTHEDSKTINYPWPIIRLGELYLAYAEALNEAEGPVDDVFKYVDEVRKRSGLLGVKASWAKSSNPTKYESKDGMREIIQRERSIEIAFEGYRNDDARRWLKAQDWFNQPVYGWTATKSTPEEYYQKKENEDVLMVFSSRNYLWPIATNEIVNNKNLVQNPGY